ncbi:TPA: aminotransferase class I/II-fold pyridoxal phosphate-dependent enzyme [Candidatus Pacearchaeota archaeon]|nr:aminotransferase class I/II-fold pyridoxal phosphate-dependent enzyme [Candidatus Pacearchaeota archaeon]
MEKIDYRPTHSGQEEKKLRVPYALAVHDEEEEKAVLEVIRAKKTILGDKTKEFEDKITNIFGKKFGIKVNSGSSANFLAFKILNFPKGSEIITPALTFATTVAPIIQNELKPVFIDVDPETYQIDLEKIEKSITEKTKALMIPHLIGNLTNLQKIKDICDKYKLAYIEDSCDTLGATFNGLPTGYFSDISTSSFYGSHIITAGGGGGIICVNNSELARKCKILRGWGRTSALDESEDLEKRFKTRLDGMDYDTKYIFEEMAYNFLPMEMGSAFGLAQLKKLRMFSEKRKEIFKELSNFFEKYQNFFILPKQLPEADTNWLAFPLTIKPGAPFTRREITRFLENENIQTRPIFTGNILRQPGFKNISDQIPEEFPITDLIMKNGFLLGCHQGLERNQLDYLKQKINNFIKKYQIS